MTVREMEGWLRRSQRELDARDVSARLARGPDLGSDDAEAWISFGSDVGSGRLVRRHDGSCRLDALRHVDGAILLGGSSPVTTAVELSAVVDALTRRSASG